VNARSWPIPPIFGHIVRRAGMSIDEAFRVFNLGIGLVAVVASDAEDAITRAISETGLDVFRIGAIVAGDGTIRLEDAGPDLLNATS
jgi:phosphoribosylformylglycinamidine cyclo-ligase